MSVNWYKVRRSFKITMFIVFFGMAHILFWAGWHNTDLLQNYSLMYNDINKLNADNEIGFYDARNIKDCNLTGCFEFKDIYMQSKFYSLVAFLIFNGIIANHFIERYKEYDDRERS